MLIWRAEKLDLIIRELTVEDMEAMRALRNEDSIRKMHLYQELISPESQLKWWNKLNKEINLYVGLFKKDSLIGVVNLKDINLEEKVAEAGAFIHPDYQGTGFVAIGSYSIMKYGFLELGLNKVLAKVLSINEPALRYNLSLGFKIIDETDQCYSIEVTSDEFFAATKRMGLLFDKQVSRS